MDKEPSFKLLDAFYEAGGNFSEFIGERVEQRGIRDQPVIATRYASNYMWGEENVKIETTYVGNNVMNSLHTLVQQSKVLYLGVSAIAAWIVSRANQYAREHLSMALAPWNVLAAGKLRSDEEEDRRRQTGRNETEIAVNRALEQVAKEAPYMFPIIGGRKIEHLEANIEPLKIKLTPEPIKFLESVVPFNPGFPRTFSGDGSEYIFLMKNTAWFDRQPLLRPITADTA
ncbi:NADP-dependent oxidoreductase domain-containing protein [Phlebopus sp. FC_14]|nr:NADP-dependent oxidoreductase domain-containing protein [Phlebopus sp. FC_14]